MGYRVFLHPKAEKALRELHEGTRARIKRGLRSLENDPFRTRSGADIKRLRGTRGRADAFRLRVGDYRVVYGVDGDMVIVTRVFHRSEGYEF